MGILLGLALVLHVVSAIEFGFGTRVASATWFLTGQFIISLSLIRLYDGRWAFQDIRLFFVIFLFLYGGTLPLIVVSGLGGFQAGLVGAAAMYGTAFLAFNIVQWWYRQPFRDVPASTFGRIRPSFGNVLILGGTFGLVLSYALAAGVTLALSINRGGAELLGTQLWVVMMFAMNGFVMYMVAGWSNLSRNARIALVLSVFAFVIFQLTMGNRRDFLPMLVFIAGVAATRKRMVIGLGTVVTGAVLFSAFTAVGIVRQVLLDPGMLARVNPVQILVTQNEFVSPIFTLMHYVGADRPLRWGATYFSAPALFVPRAFWPTKPESLSLQFMRDAFGTTGLMGFAYTPVTEAFLNFSFVGPFAVFAILSLLLVKLVKDANLRPGLYFIAFALVVDFNRGDWGGTFYALTVVGGAYWFMSLVGRLRWAPKVRRTVWPPAATGSTMSPRA